MKRAVAAVLTVAGLALVLVAVMGAVLVGPRGEWRAQGSVKAGARAVIVRPALAAVLGPRVGLRVQAADPATPLFLGRTGADDAQALVRGLPTADVVGLDGSRRLDVRSADTAAPTGSTGALPAPSTVDLWHQSAEAKGTARLRWTPTGAESFVVARADGAALPALDVTMTWRDDGWRLLPLGPLAAGAVLLAAASLLRRTGAQKGSHR
jgi:hypothetical protein